MFSLFETPWPAACQTPLSSTIYQSLLKFMSIDLVMLSNHLILCHPLLLLPSIFPSISVFSNESALLISWPKYCSFSFSISPSNENSGLISLFLYLSIYIYFGQIVIPKTALNKSYKRVSPILWPPDAKSQLIGKDPEVRKD